VPYVAEIVVADDPADWRACGFAVNDEGVCRIGSVRVRLSPGAADKGVVSWALAEIDPAVGDVDGLPTGVAELADGTALEHRNGARIIDHVVVLTPDLQRTIAALERLGIPLRATRDSDTYGRPMRQAFFRLGEVILEVVGGPEPDPRGGPARFYGLALTLDSLDSAKALLGDRMGTPKPAAQPGRFITTIHGLRVPVAVMSPEPRP
jgi:hypothetical protein